MTTADGSLSITFNGEIYNYRELRQELMRMGFALHTQSDTEVILLGYRAWGASGLLRRLQGIFAFAIYNQADHRLLLARDHMGVKPLYWWSDGVEFVFASETKALLAFPSVQAAKRVNRAGVAQVIVTRYVSRPDTLLAGVRRLPEGHLMLVGEKAETPQTYWDVRFQDRSIDAASAQRELDERLKAVIEAQLVSDVPVGVQLSGGVDSSVVAAMMAVVRRERGDPLPIKTFSVGFDIPEFSELPYARQVARRYGTDHHEIVIGANDFMEDFAKLCWYYDEPMGEPSAIPTYYMCRAAKRDVTVMLTGEGADEQFGGYSKYSFEALARRLRVLPPGLRRRSLQAAATALPFRARRLRTILEIAAIPSESDRLASWFGGFDTDEQAQVLSSEMRKSIGNGGLDSAFAAIMQNCNSQDSLERFLYFDMHARLVDDLLIKGDRMSMAASVEQRVPFLDHTLVEFAASLPAQLKVRRFERKLLLKKLAEQYLPHDVIYRRKVGFTVPLTRWFTGPLAGVVKHVVLSERALSRGYFDPAALRRVVNGHIARKVDREQAIWMLMVLEIWHQVFVDGDGSEDAATRVGRELVELSRQTS